MNRELAEALASEKTEPCTAYSCPCRSKCASDHLACESFVYYVTTRRSAHPLMMFKTNKNGWKAMNMMKQTHAPTRALYDRMFKPEESNER